MFVFVFLNALFLFAGITKVLKEPGIIIFVCLEEPLFCQADCTVSIFVSMGSTSTGTATFSNTVVAGE